MSKIILLIDKYDVTENEIRIVLERFDNCVIQTDSLEKARLFIQTLEIDLIIINQNIFNEKETLIEQLNPSSNPVLILATLNYNRLKKQIDKILNVEILKMPTLTEQFIETAKRLLNKKNE